jgi:hypothetical protein
MEAAVLDEIDALFGCAVPERSRSRPEAGTPKARTGAGHRTPAAPMRDGGAPGAHERSSAPWGEAQAAVALTHGAVRAAGQVATAMGRTQKIVSRAVSGQVGATTSRSEEAHRLPGVTERRVPEATGEGGDGGAEQARGARDFFSVHCYGGKAALCFSADTTKGEEAPTVRIEAAPATGPRAYAWAQKIAVQCTIKELPIVLATILGWMPSVRFAAHGADNKKGFSLEHQDGGKLFAKVWDGKGARMVPIAASDLFAIGDLFVRQLLRGRPYMSHDGLLTMVRQLARCYAEAGLGEQERTPGG